jgi:hypothetical protein
VEGTVDYRYELRRGEELVATGRLTREEPLAAGQTIEVAGHPGTVRSVEPVLGERELRLVVRLATGRFGLAEPGDD